MPPVLRSILAALAGYIAIALALMVLFTGIYLLLGPEWAFKPESWMASNNWVIMGIVVGLGLALGGGLLTQRIDRTGTGALILMGLILVLGIAELIWVANGAEPTEARTIASPGYMEAMNNAVQPTWLYYVNPLLGVIGVYIAMRLVPSSCPARAQRPVARATG